MNAKDRKLMQEMLKSLIEAQEVCRRALPFIIGPNKAIVQGIKDRGAAAIAAARERLAAPE